ncbi:MAG: hypothetical protein AAGA30_02215 [Planctomycetota bacterium]
MIPYITETVIGLVLFKLNLRDLFWFVLLAAVSIVAYMNNTALQETEIELRNTELKLEKQIEITDRLAEKVKQAIANGGKMYAAGRASLNQSDSSNNSVQNE